jgi:hypothetical protein
MGEWVPELFSPDNYCRLERFAYEEFFYEIFLPPDRPAWAADLRFQKIGKKIAWQGASARICTAALFPVFV